MKIKAVVLKPMHVDGDEKQGFKFTWLNTEFFIRRSHNMINMLIASVQLARRTINNHQLHRAYSLSYEAAERIKSQFIQSQVRLITPENSQPTTMYKGIVMLAAGHLLNLLH